MALPRDIIDTLARRLDDAERSCTQLRQFSLAHPDMTIDDGYAVQKAWVARKTAAGRHVIGHKIGLTSRAMQRATSITEPDYGVLLDDMLFTTGDTLPFDRFIEPRIEVELAFVLREALAGPGVTLEQVLAATAYVVPALELIDARIDRIDAASGMTRKVFDTIADNAANAAIIVGDIHTPPDAHDWPWASAILRRNGGIEESGVAAAVLEHPGNGVAWLANKLAPHGVALEAGQIVLGGSFTAPVTVARGDDFLADYGSLGMIAARFA
ncbi:2-oxo-hept-4-ene-1,7-dioate hydratase [Sphingomonas sp.]|uniref:2-oxo-hept-4-ene-1,7-dioate hydratase n=1 Tax=Sphingomonas sp. TaxID=28214 RepID=UPI003D6D5C90